MIVLFIIVVNKEMKLNFSLPWILVYLENSILESLIFTPIISKIHYFWNKGLIQNSKANKSSKLTPRTTKFSFKMIG